MGGILTRDGVEKDEVFEVGYLSPLPALSHVGSLEKLLWCGKRDASAQRKTSKEKLKILGAIQEFPTLIRMRKQQRHGDSTSKRKQRPQALLDACDTNVTK